MMQNEPDDGVGGESGAGPADDHASPVLREVDDSRSGRFRDIGTPPDAPEGPTPSGPDLPPTTLKILVIDVEFVDIEIPRSILKKYGPTGGSATDVGDWPPELKQILEKHGCSGWERTFPISYSWSTKDGSESPHTKAVASSRDRFISFYFPSNSDTPVIAHELTQLQLLARASPLTKLAPASPLDEPFVGTDDQVNPNHFCTAQGCFQNQWYLFRCGVNHAWQLIEGGLSGKGVVIADIDWGFSPSHEDLRRIEFRHNTNKDDDININNDANISNGTQIAHGTAVLGLAGAAANNLGMVGVAYESDLWAIQAGDNITDDHKHWVEAIDLVREKDSQLRRKVIILEIQTKDQGNVEQSLRINQAIKDAIAANVVVCVPAGNAGTSAELAEDGETVIPETGSILVGATKFNPDSTINERGISNFGERVVIYAPGDDTKDLTCSPDETNRAYRNSFGGTSGATAKVAGVIALMLQANKELAPAEIRDILRQTGTPVTNDPSNSGRFLNAHEAVRVALELAN